MHHDFNYNGIFTEGHSSSGSIEDQLQLRQSLYTIPSGFMLNHVQSSEGSNRYQEINAEDSRQEERYTDQVETPQACPRYVNY